MAPKKTKLSNIKQKLDIIWRLCNKESQNNITKKYYVFSSSTISRIWIKINQIIVRVLRTSQHKVMEWKRQQQYARPLTTALHQLVGYNNQFNTEDALTTMKHKMENMLETQFKKKQPKMTDYLMNTAT